MKEKEIMGHSDWLDTRGMERSQRLTGFWFGQPDVIANTEIRNIEEKTQIGR